ncbi:MAG: helix-turn-helix transcriptional regulator [Phycisphaerae bacterium]
MVMLMSAGSGEGTLGITESRLLTAAEVGVLLRVRPRTVRSWSKSGLLTPPVRVGRNGRALRWRASEIKHFIESGV